MGNPETMETDMTMDDIWQQGVDADKVNETAKSMLLVRGPYVTSPPMTVNGQHFEAGNGKPARTIFRAYGMVTWAGSEEPMHKDENGEPTTTADKIGRISFSFSPDEVVKVSEKDGKSRLDLATKLYVQLVKAYARVYGEMPATAADLKTYLEAYPVKLTIGLIGEDDVKNMVFGISPVI